MTSNNDNNNDKNGHNSGISTIGVEINLLVTRYDGMEIAWVRWGRSSRLYHSKWKIRAVPPPTRRCRFQICCYRSVWGGMGGFERVTMEYYCFKFSLSNTSQTACWTPTMIDLHRIILAMFRSSLREHKCVSWTLRGKGEPIKEINTSWIRVGTSRDIIRYTALSKIIFFWAPKKWVCHPHSRFSAKPANHRSTQLKPFSYHVTSLL